MSGNQSDAGPTVALGKSLSDVFNQVQSQIRERAYQIFLDRDPGVADPTADWLSAESELLKPVELQLKEQKKNIVAECSLKGFSPKDIEIEVEDRKLRVFGCHVESHTDDTEDGRTESSEKRSYFFQSTTLPAAVDVQKSHAKLFKNGNLKVTLPKVED